MILLFFLIGICIGSFISAISYRYPRDISFVAGRSFCPKCKKQIRWFDNIPLLSFLMLGGKCRNCKKKISVRYPLIELFTGLGFVFTYLHFFPNFALIIYYLFVLSLLALIFIVDLEHQIIPDDFIFLGLSVSIIFSLFVTDSRFLFPNLFAGFLASTFLLLLHLFTKGRGMGLGDVKFAVLGGFIVGLKLTGIWLFLSFLTGGAIGIILILLRRAGLKDKIAFGPFLVFALLSTILWGEEILHLLL